MNNLLFIALIIALIYYFFFYLPSPKKLSNPNPILTHQFTQTEPIQKDNSELEALKIKHQALIKENKDYQTQITNLQSEIRDLTKRPLQPTNSKFTQTDSDLENTLNSLIKDIQDLNNSL